MTKIKGSAFGKRGDLGVRPHPLRTLPSNDPVYHIQIMQYPHGSKFVPFVDQQNIEVLYRLGDITDCSTIALQGFHQTISCRFDI